MGDWVDVKAGESIGVKRRLFNSQDMCRPKRQNIIRNVSGAVCLAVVLINCTDDLPSPCTQLAAEPRKDQLI